ncbi:MAG: ABC transporter ATP-binding protein [Acidimicrobiales bacterium]
MYLDDGAVVAVSTHTEPSSGPTTAPWSRRTSKATTRDRADPAPDGVDDPVALLDEAASPEVGAFHVLRRGLAISPELRTGIRVTIAMALAAAVGRLVIPITIQQVLDRGVLGDAGYRPGFVWAMSLGAFAIVVGVMFAARIAQIRLIIAAEAVLLGLRVRAFEHIHRLSLADHTESRRGVLVSRVTSDVESLAQFTQWGAISWVINSAIITGTLTVMLVYNWKLTLLVVLCHLPLVPFLRWVQRRQLTAYSLVRTRVAQTLSETAEAVTGAGDRAYGYDGPVRHRPTPPSTTSTRRSSGPASGSPGCCRRRLLLVGLARRRGGRGCGGAARSTSGWASWSRSSSSSTCCSSPIAELGEVLDRDPDRVGRWWKILRVLDVPIDVVEPDDRADLPAGPLAVSVRHVDFRYRTGDQVLHDVSVDIPAEAVAVVGETGSGKTTFARLLARLADPSSRRGAGRGRAAAGGRPGGPPPGHPHGPPGRVPVRDHDRGEHPVRPPRYDANGGDGCDRAARARHLARRPARGARHRGRRAGCACPSGTAARRLSPAQVADPGLLLLDEATSAVDPETEEALAKAMATLAAGRTTISVAHRLSTAEQADLVLVFDRGRIVQQGSSTRSSPCQGVSRSIRVLDRQHPPTVIPASPPRTPVASAGRTGSVRRSPPGGKRRRADRGRSGRHR